MANDPRHDDALRAYVKLHRATRAVQGQVERQLAQVGLTLTQLAVLEALLHKGPLAHGALGRRLLTSAANLSDVVDKLEQRGLVCRRRDADDRRFVRVGLTDQGQAEISALFPRHAADIAAAMGGLSAEELRLLEELLRRLGHHAVSLQAERPAERVKAGGGTR